MKKALMVLVPLLIIIGVAAGLVFSGVVKTPWTTKKKPVVKEASVKTVPEKPVVPPTPVVPPKKVKAAPTIDTQLGDEKLAKIWNEVPSEKLLEICSQWKDAELASVLSKMDGDKVSEVLSKLEPIRASSLSRAMQKQASVIPNPSKGS